MPLNPSPLTQTYAAWKDILRRRIWASPGEPDNLRFAHDQMFDCAMSDLSQASLAIPGGGRLLNNNVSVFPACSTYVDRGMTLVEQPFGIIRRVYTIANNDWSDRVRYWPTNFKALEAKAHHIVALEDTGSLFSSSCPWTAPDNTGMTRLPQGIKHPDATTDCAQGRARVGIWATFRNRFYVFPWIQSNESLVIEWDGYKANWRDDDVIDLRLWTPEHGDAAKFYVQWQHELDYGCDPERRETFKREYESARANVMYLERMQVEVQEADEPINERSATKAEVDDDAVPIVALNPVVFAFISDFGYPFDVFEGQVANMVKSWGPSFILTGGDNLQPGGLGSTALYSEAVTPFYGDYLSANLSQNRFWPAVGNHDYYNPTNGIQDFLDFFNTPDRRLYYDLVKGPCHFFFIDSVPTNATYATPTPLPINPDGFSATSIQATWLHAKLALSTSPWKIVIFHHPPYTTFGTNPANRSSYPGSEYMRWPFKDWGVDVVLGGHNHLYERFLVNGVHYLVAGNGGADLVAGRDVGNFPLVSSYLQARSWAKHGALYCTATCGVLDIKSVDVDGTVIDTLTMTKPGVAVASVPGPGIVVPTVPSTTPIGEIDVRNLVLVMADGTKVQLVPLRVEDTIQLVPTEIP